MDREGIPDTEVFVVKVSVLNTVLEQSNYHNVQRGVVATEIIVLF